LGFVDDAFLHELAEGVLGCNYPSPVRMLSHSEEIIAYYLHKELSGGHPLTGKMDLFAVEGATAGITYTFNSLREKSADRTGRYNRDRNANLRPLYRYSPAK